MLDLAPAYTQPLLVAPADADEGHREFQVITALSEYCYRERSRVRMLAILRETLEPHGVLVLDAHCWRPKQKRWWD